MAANTAEQNFGEGVFCVNHIARNDEKNKAARPQKQTSTPYEFLFDCARKCSLARSS
jgi:hypothetical protein